MDDPRLRAEFHLAIDAVAPPAPWLFAVVRDDLRQRSHERPARQAAARVIGRPTWVLPLVAVVLSVAIVLALLFVAVELHPSRTIPVKPPPGPAAGGCPVWGTQSAGGFVPAPDTMSTASTGWSNGALRTTDGGAHWRDVSPAAMRADAPSGTGKRDYPPSYADFFLDSTHAWIARTYQSVTSCLDHVSVFMTADGGRTWRTSMPVGAAVRADSSAQRIQGHTLGLDPLPVLSRTGCSAPQPEGQGRTRSLGYRARN